MEDVDVDVEVLVLLFVKELVEAHMDGALDVGEIMAMSFEGRVLIDQGWSSLSTSR
jgi:hypothetical protein